MTAIGLVLLAIGLVGHKVAYDPVEEFLAGQPSMVRGAFAFVAVVGGALVMAGAATWLWRVAP